MSLSAAEKAKYQRCWADERYRVHSPGEQMLPLFRQMVRRTDGWQPSLAPIMNHHTLVDIGSGTGRASLALSEMGYDVTMLDFAENAAEVDLPFVKCNLFGRWPDMWWDQGYCCDVMEHIPPERVERVLENIAGHVGRCFFSIHFGPDHFGAIVGHPLHLTIRPFEWWQASLSEYGKVKQSRDLLGMGVFDVRF